MRFTTAAEPITDDDETIRAGVVDAPVPALLTAVAHLTGDHSLLRDDLKPDLSRVLEPDAGYSAEQLALARGLAADALIRYRDGGSVPAGPLDGDGLRRFVEFVAGGPVADDYLPLLEEELALDGADLRAPQWQASDLAPGVPFTVGIVGAGMSGIIAAHRLRQAGVPVVIFEKNPGVGGTWYENRYPGCRVDIPNHFYSYACAQTSDWPQFYSQQRALLGYFEHCVDQFGIRDAIHFGTEVLEATWDDDTQAWNVRVRDAYGEERTEVVQALVSAVGQLNQPLLPEIEGMETFAGPSFHSARWDTGVDLTGKRVAVIGTGASAAQFIPVIADQVEQLTVFQRTPPWLLPVANYMDDLPESLRWLLRHVPEYSHWDRLWIFARTQEGLLPLAAVDPTWDQSGSVGPLNDMLRQLLTAFYDIAFADADLRAQVLPQYPPVAKRVILDNGAYPAALQRDNVTLTTTPIVCITETGVRTADGVDHEVDVIVYGTGFQASKFLTPMAVHGTGGADLHARWGGDARAYLGIVVPEFPNLYLMYGPNTNIVINGSIIYFSECEAHYIVESVRMLLEGGWASMDCTHAVHDAYNERIDAGNRAMAWGASDVNSWYKNEFGRVAQNWPFNLFEYWRQTRTPDPGDYELVPRTR